MNNWKRKLLHEVADVKLSNVDKKFLIDEIKVRLCNYTDVYKNAYINSEKAKSFMVASCKQNELDTFRLNEGQVAITKDSETRDDIGVSTYISESFEDVVLGYHTSLITPYPKLLSGKYLHYWLNTKQAKVYFENNAGGSGQRCTLPIDIIKAIPLHLPPIDLQEQIATLFYNIDSKIELNNLIKAELEAIAKTLYDYWFVQFDFPNAKGKPYKTSGGTMVWNEELKREIPEGWEVNKIENFCRIFTGKKDVNQATDKGKYKFFSCSPNYKFSNDKLYEGKAILISGNGSYTGRTIFVDEGFDLYQRTYACVNATETDILPYLYFSILRFLSLKIGGGTHGSAIPYIVYDDIAKETFAYNFEVVSNFQEIINPILSNIKSTDIQTIKLTELRDWLLPMLMNGQVKVN